MGNCTKGRKCGFGSDEADGASSIEDHQGPDGPGKDGEDNSRTVDRQAFHTRHNSMVLSVLPSLDKAQSSTSLQSTETASSAGKWEDDFIDSESSEEEGSGSDWCATDNELSKNTHHVR